MKPRQNRIQPKQTPPKQTTQNKPNYWRFVPPEKSTWPNGQWSSHGNRIEFAEPYFIRVYAMSEVPQEILDTNPKYQAWLAEQEAIARAQQAKREARDDDDYFPDALERRRDIDNKYPPFEGESEKE